MEQETIKSIKITKEDTDALIKDMSDLILRMQLHNENNVLRYEIGRARIENFRQIKSRL